MRASIKPFKFLITAAAAGLLAACAGFEWTDPSTGFDRVRPGMSQTELLGLLGPPSHRMFVLWGAQVWSWRYPNNDCLWFRVDITEQGTVKHGGSFGPDPLCDAPSDRD